MNRLLLTTLTLFMGGVQAAPIAMEDQSQLQPSAGHAAVSQFQPPQESELPVIQVCQLGNGLGDQRV